MNSEVEGISEKATESLYLSHCFAQCCKSQLEPVWSHLAICLNEWDAILNHFILALIWPQTADISGNLWRYWVVNTQYLAGYWLQRKFRLRRVRLASKPVSLPHQIDYHRYFCVIPVGSPAGHAESRFRSWHIQELQQKLLQICCFIDESVWTEIGFCMWAVLAKWYSTMDSGKISVARCAA